MKHLAAIIAGATLVTSVGVAWAMTAKVGGDRDAHGCIPSAGYQWCSAKKKCIRPWEEKCGGSTTSSSISRSCTKQECGPAMGMPNRQCPDGSIGGPICERKSNGKCGYVVHTCSSASSVTGGKPAKPSCGAVGTRSEGWVLPNKTIQYANCAQCKAECRYGGTKSEGWYDSCTKKLIVWGACSS